jgi:hypothetical protein
MSSMKITLVAAIILALVAPAAAGGRVDWSDYIDRDAKPTPVAAAQPREEAAPVRTKKAAKAKKAKKVAKSKAAKAKARKKKARR